MKIALLVPFTLQGLQMVGFSKGEESISTSKIDCEQCNYHASATTVLKRTMTVKHPSKHTPEVLMEHEPDTVLHLDQPTGERVENSNPLQKDVSILEEVELKCDYWRCAFKSNTISELLLHINMKHAIDQSYVYPNSTVEIQCADCDEMFLEDHNHAIHCFHKHLYSYDCDHCHKHFPGDSAM